MIWCDDGRLTRLVKTGQDLKCSDWYQGVIEGELQWIDAFEEEYGFENMNYSREIDTSNIFGISASLIPLINSQPCPRSVYSTNMNKQAVSCLGPSQNLKYATTINIGVNKRPPLLTTHFANLIEFNKYPSGNNCIVAITPYFGYNQEDAIIINKASVERGLFKSVSFKTIFFEEESESEIFKIVKIPEKNIRKNNLNYCMLDKNGVVKKGSKVLFGDVLVGVVNNKKMSNMDCSIYYEKTEPAIVYDVHLCEINSHKHVKIVLVHDLPCFVADKFASRHGQKGIVSLFVKYTEMPYLEDGTVPDILISPLSLPSRATPTITEGLLNLISIYTNKQVVLSSFDNIFNQFDIENILENYGIDKNGVFKMRNNVDGELMVPIFTAPIYYNRLPHFASHKCYARSNGIMSKQTRQPTDGRSRQGGLRIGEMERDAIIGLEMPHVLEDRFFYNSDKFWVYICSVCKNKAINSDLCMCNKSNNSLIKKIKMSFTSNLIFNQLIALTCKLEFGLDKKDFNKNELVKIYKNYWQIENLNSTNSTNSTDSNTSSSESDEQESVEYNEDLLNTFNEPSEDED